MSSAITQYLADMAQFKLWAEAARPTPELRLLVGHANLVELLMLELQLADPGQPQETPHRRTQEGAGGAGGTSRFVEDIEDYGHFRIGSASSKSYSHSSDSSDSDGSSDSDDSSDSPLWR